jgi:hypothetical protein
MAVSEKKGSRMPKKTDPTSDGVYDWAVANDVPAPDAFAVRYWDLDGRSVLLKLAARLWRRQVNAGRTGFPVIDGRRTDS